VHFLEVSRLPGGVHFLEVGLSGDALLQKTAV